MGKAAAMTPAAAQEPLTEQQRAGAAAPVAVRSRAASLGRPGRRRRVWPGHRGRRQQITVDRRGSTVMRHFLLPPLRWHSNGCAVGTFSQLRPPTAHPGRVHAAATMARLVAPPSLPDRVSPRLPGTATGAVELTAVAATANDHLLAATGAQEQTTRGRISLTCLAGPAWTNAMVGRIVGLHACPARCGARRRR